MLAKSRLKNDVPEEVVQFTMVTMLVGSGHRATAADAPR